MARTTKRFLVALVVVAVAVAVVLQVSDPTGPLGEGTYLAVTCGAAAFALVVVLRRRVRDVVPVMVAWGLVASAFGDVIWEIYVLDYGVGPDVSLADVGWIASYICLAAALLSLIRRGDHRLRGDPDALLDMSVAAVIVALAAWLLWIAPTLSDPDTSVVVRAVWALYPVLDVALLALLGRTLWHRTVRGPAMAILGGGLVLFLVADLSYLSLTEWSWVVPANNVAWVLGAVMLAAAVWTFDGVDAEVRHRRQLSAMRRPIGRWRVAFAVIPLAVPWAIALWAYVDGRDPDPVPLAIASGALGALVCARIFHVMALQRETEQLYRVAATNSSDATLILSAEGRLLHDAPGLCTLLRGEGIGDAGTDIAAVTERLVDGGESFPDVIRRVLEHPSGALEREIRATTLDGGRIWLSVRAVNLLDDPGLGAVLVNLHDISDRKRAEQELEFQAFHDSLTGLPNRGLFNDRLSHAIAQRARTGLDPVVLFLDLDRFKHVNDRLGHDAGDRLLAEVARRLGATVRPGDTVARLGGDEFAVLIENSRDGLTDAEAVAERILTAIVRPIDIAETSITVTASIGIAPGDWDSTPQSLLRDADTAMYHAKAAGRARSITYDKEMRQRDDIRVRVETEIGSALQRGQLTVEYQPVVDLSTTDVVGFEALVRWDHPEIGRIGPEVFVPSAERSGDIIPIGEWVLARACDQLARWRAQHDTDLSLAVNVSARQLADPALSSTITRALRASGIDPHDLILEITETSLVDDPAAAQSTLDDVRALGVRIAIDDFGTGYSSLSYLDRLPVDILKIDRSFVSGIGRGDVVPDIVRGILDLARTLHLKTVAEGVETDAQRTLLSDNGCDLGQGFLFARPLAVDDAGAVIGHRPGRDPGNPPVSAVGDRSVRSG